MLQLGCASTPRGYVAMNASLGTGGLVGFRQQLTIPDWLPEQIANGPHGHWSTRYRRLRNAQETVWGHAVAARWRPIKCKAKLDVMFRFPQYRRRDADNLYARAKGVVDGVKRGGWIVDDSPEWLDLRVWATVERGTRSTVLTLEEIA